MTRSHNGTGWMKANARVMVEGTPASGFQVYWKHGPGEWVPRGRRKSLEAAQAHAARLRANAVPNNVRPFWD